MLQKRAVHSTLGCLLLALFVFTGTLTSVGAYADAQVPVQCCDKDTVPRAPADEGECFDCRCLICNAALPVPTAGPVFVGPVPASPVWFLDAGHPSAHIQSIDYPPELG